MINFIDLQVTMLMTAPDFIFQEEMKSQMSKQRLTGGRYLKVHAAINEASAKDTNI